MICVLDAASREPADLTRLKAVWRGIGAPLSYPDATSWTEEQLAVGRAEELIVEVDGVLNFNPLLKKHSIFARGGVPEEEAILVGALMGLTEGDVFNMLELRVA